MVEAGGLNQAPAVSDEGPVDLKPTIKEVIRTQFCPPLRLLVDRVHFLRYGDGDATGAYRLWLSDGQKSIQALPRREIHPFLASQEIRAGTVVLLSKYLLSKARKLSGDGDVWILLIEALQPIGHDGRMIDDFTVEQRAAQGRRKVAPETPTDGAFTQLLAGLGGNVTTDGDSSEGETDDHRRSPSELASRKRRPEGPSTPLKGPQYTADSPTPRTPKQPPHGASATAVAPGAGPPAGPGNLRQITRPLKITALASVIGPKATRNRVLDVIGIIVDVSPDVIRRPKMPDQRDLRIMDPSTAKRVQLTVFVDAHDFVPAVGTVALFRNVTTHEWNGGSLKAYPRDCEGREWYFPNPTWLEGFDAEELRAWWLKGMASEEAEREKEEREP